MLSVTLSEGGAERRKKAARKPIGCQGRFFFLSFSVVAEGEGEGEGPQRAQKREVLVVTLEEDLVVPPVWVPQAWALPFIASPAPP